MPEQIILEEKTSNVQSNAVDSVALNLRGRDGRCLEVSHLIILGIIGILVVVIFVPLVCCTKLSLNAVPKIASVFIALYMIASTVFR
ncbi:19222_t:CDS:2, partial [Gigaspora rosea]